MHNRITISRGTREWKRFTLFQKIRIQRRLSRYNNRKTVEEQLREMGDITPYQRYKIGVVSPFLKQALNRIETGTYGYCLNCHGEIPLQRLILVPGALRCITCETTNPPK